MVIFYNDFHLYVFQNESFKRIITVNKVGLFKIENIELEKSQLSFYQNKKH